MLYFEIIVIIIFVGLRSVSGNKVDVAFVIDSSGSIAWHGSQNWELVLNFTQNIVSKLPVSQDKTQIAVVIYSDEASVAFCLDDYNTAQSVSNKIYELLQFYQGGSTNTKGALRLLIDGIFTDDCGDRHDAPNIGIIITDGSSNSGPEQTIAEAERAKRRNITLIAVGISNRVDIREIRGIASQPHEWNYFTASDFDQLGGLVDGILASINSIVEEIDECISQPCHSNGVCLDRVGAYECNCTGTGFEGDICNIGIDECFSQPCQNDGVCLDDVGSYECNCSGTGFEGDICSLEIDECISQPCHNDGVCLDGVGSYECNCTGTGFEGDICSIGIDECISQPCHNDGVCIDGVGSYECNCTGTGFEGDVCNIEIDECHSQPCHNDGVCLDGVGSYECSCTGTGFEGDVCNIGFKADVAFVLDGSGSIAWHGENNWEFVSNFTQSVVSRFSVGLNDVQMSVILFSNEASIVFCLDSYDTTQSINSHIKDLGNDYDGGSTNTQDALRLLIDGVFTDDCGDRRDATNIGILVTDGESDTSRQDTISEAERARRNNITLIAIGISDRIDVLEIRGIASQPHEHNYYIASDFQDILGFIDGIVAAVQNVATEECDSEFCLNGGLCINEVGHNMCDCRGLGYEGDHCQNEIDECVSNPCLNGGICLDDSAFYECNCTDTQFEGVHCETAIYENKCGGSPCLNGGLCTPTNSSYGCHCAGTGYSGAHCEQAIKNTTPGPGYIVYSIENASVSIMCETDGLGRFYSWSVNGKSPRDGIVGHNSNTLVIPHLSLKDFGRYTCIVNRFKELNINTYNLQNIADTSNATTRYRAQLGEAIQLKCPLCTGISKIDCKWTRGDNKPLRDGIVTGEDYTVAITEVQKDDFGEYICKGSYLNHNTDTWSTIHLSEMHYQKSNLGAIIGGICVIIISILVVLLVIIFLVRRRRRRRRRQKSGINMNSQRSSLSGYQDLYGSGVGATYQENPNSSLHDTYLTPAPKAPPLRIESDDQAAYMDLYEKKFRKPKIDDNSSVDSNDVPTIGLDTELNIAKYREKVERHERYVKLKNQNKDDYEDLNSRA